MRLRNIVLATALTGVGGTVVFVLGRKLWQGLPAGKLAMQLKKTARDEGYELDDKLSQRVLAALLKGSDPAKIQAIIDEPPADNEAFQKAVKEAIRTSTN